MSKGSASRPFAVDRDTFASNFDAIFGKKKSEPCKHDRTIAKPEDDITLMHCIDCGAKVPWLVMVDVPPL